MRSSNSGSFTHHFLILATVLVLMQVTVAQPVVASSFETFLAERFGAKDGGWDLETFCPVSSSVVAERVLREYGAMFAAVESVRLPKVCIFLSEGEVLQFQKKLETKTIEPGGVRVTLQTPAADALQKAIDQAAEQNLMITPYDGAIGGSRSYGDTLRLWNGRFFSALDHWSRRGRLTTADREAISRLDLQKRIEMIIEWESRGIYFSTDRARSIFSSTAPPGASQHLAMLAFDVAEYARPEIRSILNQNGWYQTVAGDPLHFTFLGVPENELPSRGLKSIDKGSHRYWVPNMSTATR